MPSRVDVEDVQGKGALSARGQVDESLDDLGPKAEVLQLGADFDRRGILSVLNCLIATDVADERSPTRRCWPPSRPKPRNNSRSKRRKESDSPTSAHTQDSSGRRRRRRRCARPPPPRRPSRLTRHKGSKTWEWSV